MAQALRNLSELFVLWQSDIRAWWEDNLPPGECPRDWQEAFLEAVSALLEAKGKVRAAVAACRGAGKTRAAAILVLWFMDTRPDCLVVTIAPVWSQVVQALWAEIRSLWALSAVSKRRRDWEILTHEIKTPSPMWRAYGMAAKDPQNLEGRHGKTAVCIIVDESKAVSEEINNSIRGMLWRKGVESLLVAIGTPGSPVGWFYRAFAQERAKWDLVTQVSAWEIPSLVERAAEELERLGENNPWYRQQQLAEFAGADEFTILPLHLITKAQTVEAYERCERLFPRPSRTLALDPAGRGADESVLSFRLGGILSGQQAWQGWDEMQTAAYSAGQAREWRPEVVVVDEIGIGAGIRSRIAELLGGAARGRGRARGGSSIRVMGYNAGNRAYDHERFANRKTEDLFRLRERFEAGEVSLPDDAPMLIQNLCSYRWKPTTGGKTKVEDPEEDSPDYGDSYLMTYASERQGGVRAFSPKFL
jgi:hypothetical protein